MVHGGDAVAEELTKLYNSIHNNRKNEYFPLVHDFEL